MACIFLKYNKETLKHNMKAERVVAASSPTLHTSVRSTLVKMSQINFLLIPVC